MDPCLLIFEDLHSMVDSHTRLHFLNGVDGLESNDGILMIGSVHDFGSLDVAMTKRSSRFDRKYHFKLPDERERKLYMEFWKRNWREREAIWWALRMNCMRLWRRLPRDSVLLI